jgi:hypothetical protein
MERGHLGRMAAGETPALRVVLLKSLMPIHGHFPAKPVLGPTFTSG